MFREVLDRSVTVPVLKHSHPLALCVRYGRWRARVHKPVLPCRGRVLPHSSHPWRAFLICPISSLFRDLAREPCLASHLCALPSRAADDAAISNPTIVYPGDLRVIAHRYSSSLWRTTSMIDLGEEFESALRWAKDARPGLGSGLGLAGAIIGEGSPVTVSSG